MQSVNIQAQLPNTAEQQNVINITQRVKTTSKAHYFMPKKTHKFLDQAHFPLTKEVNLT